MADRANQFFTINMDAGSGEASFELKDRFLERDSLWQVDVLQDLLFDIENAFDDAVELYGDKYWDEKEV